SFAARQLLDVFSPSNFLMTNPQLLQETAAQGGANLYRGWLNALEDVERRLAGRGPAGTEAFRPGEPLAVTPGRVVYRTCLWELTQWSAAAGQGRPESVLIVPAWIIKYYILDLSLANSLIRYVVAQGPTVSCVSWKTPDAEDRELDLDGYRRLGIKAALDA